MSPTANFEDECILVTGGTGSFGKVAMSQLLRRGVREVRVLSRDEAKQHALRTATADKRVSFWIGDVRDPQAVCAAMDGVDRVFHAAALKQVPSCEFFPIEAVLTNIIGSDNVVRAGTQAGVRSIICLSTDKAVLPVNAMGMTKALMEKVAQASVRHTSTDTVVATVRYGNVMYSRGSVLPLFFDHALRGEALPVTDPDMTRFLLLLDEAFDLVETAFVHANGGDTFIRKAPAATIADLAAAVQKYLGVDVGTRTIGVRHGEKTYETLATAEELRSAEDLGRYWRLPMDARDLNYEVYFDDGFAQPLGDDFHSHNAERLAVDEVVALLDRIPEARQARSQAR